MMLDFSADFRDKNRNRLEQSGGLGNRCSILLSYGALAVFLGFLPLAVNSTAQNAQRSHFHVGT
jgi:hypothetical protein